MIVPAAAVFGFLLALGVAAARRRGRRGLVLAGVFIGMVAIVAVSVSGVEHRAFALMAGTIAMVVTYVLSDITESSAGHRRD